MNETTLTNDEKLLGLFSHLSLFFGGIIVPIIFWAINKDKSKFVTFHALQALFFHIAYIVLIIFLVIILVIAGFGVSFLSFGLHSTTSSGAPVLIIIFIIVFYGILFLTMFFMIGYSIYMSIKAYHGELKKYPIIGKMVYKHVYNS